jgi:hypothetical protein
MQRLLLIVQTLPARPFESFFLNKNIFISFKYY